MQKALNIRTDSSHFSVNKIINISDEYANKKIKIGYSRTTEKYTEFKNPTFRLPFSA